MNKQELIERIDSKMFAYPSIEPETEDDTTVEFKKGFNCACENIKRLADQKLDEPEKVVVPKFVAKKIESYGSALEMLANEYFDQSSEEVDSDELACWIDGNADLFFNAWVCGYEVEKEQLYYVKFDILYLQKYLVKNVETDQFYLSNNEKVVGNYEQVRFTEQEIKSIDERYWPFAVKVDGEQMKYKTKYSSIVPKGQIGECIDKVDGELLALLIKFGNGEVFWFMKRDLIEVEDK